MYRYGTASKQSSFRSDFPLTNEQIGLYAPSVLASEAHESRGERYAFIPTLTVLDGLRANGFQPFEVRQTKVRDQGKREHTKHLVRLRHADHLTQQGEVPEVILLNSHDGTSSYQLLAGIFRFVCSNGLIAGDVCNDIRIRHSGNVVDNVIEGSFQVLDNLKEVESRVDQYKAITVTPAEKLLLANAVTEVRWGSDEEAPIDPANLLRPRRWEDRKDDLWSLTNVLQENVIQGGIRGKSKNGRRTSTRAVGGVNENVRLNKAIWTLTDRFAQLKAA
jgi:hypothetical protein